MCECSELVCKGIVWVKSVVVLVYVGGVLFVVENLLWLLQKISEFYDWVGFVVVGKFNEFDNLCCGGIQFVDICGYVYDCCDVMGWQLVNVYVQILGIIFIEQVKFYEVELCVVEVVYYGEMKFFELYCIIYDGLIVDELYFVVMGGIMELIVNVFKELYVENVSLIDVLCIVVVVLWVGSVDILGGD